MKRNRTLPLALVTFAALTFASNAAWANHHWGNNNGMGNQGYSQLTQEQQATRQKLHNDYYAQPAPCASSCSPNAMSTMRCSRRKSRTAGRLKLSLRRWKAYARSWISSG